MTLEPCVTNPSEDSSHSWGKKNISKQEKRAPAATWLASIFIRNAWPRVGLFRWQQRKYNNQYKRVKETLAITPVRIHIPVLYPRSCSISTELFPRHHGVYCSKRGEMAELNIYFLIWQFWATSPAIQLTVITKPEAVASALASGKKLHFRANKFYEK